ncbi:hypothetical protein [Fodinibius halophilus]|uniref:Uncharacterized protein n=1 Tax=Fodinibius halophilus TaxID=1736908 RepID=A0A6M1T0M6_9BACT|nr:hypothetical protein [Fodinibius halophilus]NGP89648.1 hypothetical protein [Fodinibius halophilus]
MPEEPNERLAYALAAAMDNPEVRQSVHEAMDASPYHEHKLVLGSFLQEARGSILKSSLAERLGGVDELKQLIQELPALDFYLPYETHRETWEHADDNLMAVCVLNVHAKQATAYHPDGSSRTLSSEEQIHQAEVAAMFTLHPAEPKSYRTAAESQASGSLQQSTRWHTRLSKIKNWTSDGIFGGDCEIYFETYLNKVDSPHLYRSNNIHAHSGSDDDPSTTDISPLAAIHPDKVSERELYTRVYESDGGWGGINKDDTYGTKVLTKEGSYSIDNANPVRNPPKIEATFVID